MMLHELEEIVRAEKRVSEKLEEEKRTLLLQEERYNEEMEQRFREESEKIEAEFRTVLEKGLKNEEDENRRKLQEIDKKVEAVLSHDRCRTEIAGRIYDMLINTS